MEKKGFIAAWKKCPPKIRIFGKCESIFTTHVATEVMSYGNPTVFPQPAI